MTLVLAWVKVEYQFQYLTFTGNMTFLGYPGDNSNRVTGDYANARTQSGPSAYLEVGDTGYVQAPGRPYYYWAHTYQGTLEIVPPYGGVGIFNTHTNVILLQSRVVEVTTDALNVFDTSLVDLVTAYLPPSLALPGAGVEADPMWIAEGASVSHAHFEWVQTWVEIIDLDGNGYDDRGEHDAGPQQWWESDVDLRDPDAPPPLPPLPAIPEAVEAQAFVDGFNALVGFVKEIAPGDKRAAFKFLEKLATPIEVASEAANAAAVWENPGSSDVDRNVALTMAIISSAVAVGFGLAGPVGAGAGLLYTFYLKAELEQVVRAYWEEQAAGAASTSYLALGAEGASSLGAAVLEILSTATIFDPVYYGAQHPDAVQAVEAGSSSSLLAYFLVIGAARGDLPSAGSAQVDPGDLVFALPNNDAGAGSRGNLSWAAQGTYVGDGLDHRELALADLLRGDEPEANLDAQLTVLANRIAIDLALNADRYQSLGLTGIDLGTRDAFSDGASIDALFPGLDPSHIRFYVVSGLAASASVANAQLEAAGVIPALLSGAQAIGVAEYGGVWVVAVSSDAATAAPSAGTDFTLIRYGSQSSDDLYAGARASKLYGLNGDDRLYGGDAGDLLDGGEGEDFLSGRGGGDVLLGLDGADVLNGGKGADHMTGSLGDDTYIVDNVGDVIVEVTGQGTDTVRSSISFAFSGQSLENLTLTGSANINATANSKSNILVGNTGNNVLDGKAGADRMTGGKGNDTYIVDDAGDVIVEVTGEGTDTVKSSISFAFTGQSLENLTLTGSANINATANSKANTLLGNSGNNILDGKTGADRMTGGLGDDTYVVDNARDVIVEVTGEGTDTVRSSISFAFSGQSLENLILTGTANINGTANSKANILVGNSGNNVLDGKTGADTMTGGLGDDTYVVDNAGDVIVEVTGQGTDTVRSSITFAFSGQSLENLTLTGTANINATANSKANIVIGNTGKNIIDGKGGADVMTGGGGVDTFTFGSTAESTLAASDRITDLSAGDFIDLSRIDANTTVGGVQHFSLVDAFTNTAGQVTLTYDVGTNITSLMADTNGDGTADMLIRINGDHDDHAKFIFGG